MRSSILTFLLIYINIHISSSLNVLVWSTTIGQSHINFMGSIADTLVEDGNNVTMLVIENDPDVISTGANLVKQFIWYASPLVDSQEWALHNFKRGNIYQTSTFDLEDHFRMQDINYRICKSLLADDEFINMLKSCKFDVAVVEMFHFCPSGILHAAGVPKIIIASALGVTFAHNELLGLQTPLSHVPSFMTHMGSKMSFLDRLYNVVFFYCSKILYWRMYYSEQALFHEKFGSFPDLSKLYKDKLDYLLLNSNEFTEATRPTLRSVMYVGGSATKDPVLLSRDFEEILQKANKGSVLFSLGSLVKSNKMPTRVRQAFLDAFRAFPDYQFIWKDDFSSNFTHPNINYRKWVPQVDLLADQRIKLFITHGGLNSIQESLIFGVPMITMPIFADQDSNAALAAERGYSITLDKFSVTKEDIIKAIQAVLGSDNFESSYASKAKHASRVLKGSPRTMRKEIQRVVRVSATEPYLEHLKINSDHLNLLQFFNVDVHAFILGSLVFFIVLSCKFVDYYLSYSATRTQKCKLL